MNVILNMSNQSELAYPIAFANCSAFSFITAPETGNFLSCAIVIHLIITSSMLLYKHCHKHFLLADLFNTLTALQAAGDM